MKRFIIIALLIFPIATLSAQTKVNIKDKAVPQSVMQSFKKLYAHIKKTDWSLNGTTYEVEFLINLKDVSAFFDAGGNWLHTNYDVDDDMIRTGLPATCIIFVDNNYKACGIISAQIRLDPGGTSFIITIDPDKDKKTREKINLYFAENGTYLKQEAR